MRSTAPDQVVEQPSRATTMSLPQLATNLPRSKWNRPEPFGPDGWLIDARDGRTRIIVTTAPHSGAEWHHASISHPNRMPDYRELAMLHRVVWPDGWSYQVFAPPSDHVNIHEFALHLWGHVDGSALLPNFGENGTI